MREGRRGEARAPGTRLDRCERSGRMNSARQPPRPGRHAHEWPTDVAHGEWTTGASEALIDDALLLRRATVTAAASAGASAVCREAEATMYKKQSASRESDCDWGGVTPRG